MLRLALFLLPCAVLAAFPALGQEPPAVDPPTQERPADEPAADDIPTRQSIGELSLDELFARLAAQGEARGGKIVEAEILKRFNRSGSDTADLLMGWAAQSIEEKKYPQALDILDQIVVLKPDFAEAWNKRATVHFLRDDYASSLADIRETLALEPRHFGALSGLGVILQETGKEEQALGVYRKALGIDPLLDKVRESVERLERDVSGNSI